MMQSNKVQYKLQKEDSKKISKFKNFKLKKDKVLHIAIGTIYVTCLIAEMIFVANFDIPNNINDMSQIKQGNVQNKTKTKVFNRVSN